MRSSLCLFTPWSGRPRWLAWVALLALALAASGCSTVRGTPQRYVSAQAVVKEIDLTPADLASLVVATSPSERNTLQNKSVAVIDLWFNEFVRDLNAERNDASAAVAGTTLGASTAGAFVNSVKAKTNYALLGAGVVGAFGIMDKTYFYEKTVPALVAAMGSARAQVLLRMRNRQAESIADYSGDAALRDLEDYYNAGTLLAGIAEATTSAERDKKDALDQVRVLGVPDDAEINRRRQLTRATWSIKDPASMDQGNKALKALGLPTQTTAKETGLALRRAMQPPTDENLRRVEKALRDAELLK